MNKTMIVNNIVIDRVEAYDASALDCYAFRRGTDVRGGKALPLGNMVSGYPFEIEGVRFDNSECAYICGAFSDCTECHYAIQRQLVACTNGYLSKKVIRRPHETEKRTDWEAFNIQWMLYVVWQKCLDNQDFARVLTAIPVHAVIIEDSTFQNGRTATMWGTRNMELKRQLCAYKKQLNTLGLTKAEIKRRLDAHRLGALSRIGVFEGKNIMGKILMLCRDALLNGTEPQIDYKLLRSANIWLNGRKLTFTGRKEVAA